MTRTLALLVLTVALVGACSRSTKPTPDSTRPASSKPAKPFDGKPTAALVHRPEVAALVDVLAASGEIESSHIGAAGAPSAVYAKFEALVKAATDDEMAALLTHASPVVRGYAAQRVAGDVPAHVGELATLAEDDTSVETLEGCMKGTTSVGKVVRDALCDSPLAEAGAALVTVHDRHGLEAAAALACAAPIQPRLAGEAAVRELRARNLPPLDQAAYLRVLGVARPPDPAEGCTFAREGAQSSDASVQIGAAQALGHCDDAASLALLERLAAGKNVVVGRHARASIFVRVPERRDALSGEADVMREVSDRLGSELRSPEGTKTVIALAETLALAYPETLGAPFRHAVAAPETTAAARRIAAKLEPTKAAFAYPTARASVIDYLARTRDQASLPELRRSIASGGPQEMVSALRGIEAMHDTESRAAVEALTHHADHDVAEAAKRALATL